MESAIDVKRDPQQNPAPAHTRKMSTSRLLCATAVMSAATSVHRTFSWVPWRLSMPELTERNLILILVRVITLKYRNMVITPQLLHQIRYDVHERLSRISPAVPCVRWVHSNTEPGEIAISRADLPLWLRYLNRFSTQIIPQYRNKDYT